MIINNLIKKNKNFIVIDSMFPQKDPYGFRNIEINEYLSRIKNFNSYTMHTMLPDKDAWFSHGYGMSKEDYNENKKGYISHYPENSKRIHYLDKTKKYRFGLAYSFFLSETYVLLPFYEKNKIPFVFVLYPGGGFGLNNEGSDRMLSKIFKSKYFRGVIVTQKITHDYLLQKNLCIPEKLHYIYGGFVQFKKNQVQKKQVYKKDKQTFDICFVAAKYTEKGIDKGYDVFIETAKILAKQHDDIRIHVIGGFDETDIDIRDIKNKITFYGFKEPEFLVNLYSYMDIFIGPGRYSKIYPGNFDGFPLGIDAGYCGVALFVSDDLNMNQYYTDSEDIILTNHSPTDIAEKVTSYILEPKRLEMLSIKCMLRTQELFDINRQIDSRLEVFNKYIKIKDRLGTI